MCPQEAYKNLPRARRDLLILDPSLNLTPLYPVAAPRSDPARSIMDSLEMVTVALTLASRSCWRTNICSTKAQLLVWILITCSHGLKYSIVTWYYFQGITLTLLIILLLDSIFDSHLDTRFHDIPLTLLTIILLMDSIFNRYLDTRFHGITLLVINSTREKRASLPLLLSSFVTTS